MAKQGKPLKNNKKDLAIFLHGLCCSARQMAGLARAFNKAGMAELIIDYDSTDIDFDEFSDLLHKEVERHKGQYNKIHFVGFSLGGVLIRHYLEKYPPVNLEDQLGRVLFLGSPMRGCAFIDVINTFLPASKVFGLAGGNLAHNHPNLPKKKVSYEAGVIAGDKGQVPFLTDFILGSKNDGIVALSSTRVKGMRDSIVLPVDHLSFTDHTSVQEQAVTFATTGQFDHGKRYRREYRWPNIF